MARKPISKQTEPTRTTELTMSREEAKSRLQDRVDKGMAIKQSQASTAEAYEASSNEYSKWDSFNAELLKRMFTTEELAAEYSWYGVPQMALRLPTLGEQIAQLYRGIDEKIHRIDSIIERLELFPLAASLHAEAGDAKPDATPSARNQKVFVVHGHDEIAKTNLEVFLHEIGLEPVVLHRQADEGLTVIEKFEKHSDVGYAFILLTPDEVAYLASEDAKPDDERKKESRARPNVIFEFGYFVGKLGRPRVCCLYTGNVSLPSDVQGMIYKKFVGSIEEIGYSIIKDLKASGYAIA